MRVVRLGLVGVVVLALGIQLIPYGRGHTNPPSGAEPAWDSARTRELAVRACFDCHSNQTTWPWYSNVAPVSWLVQRDVDEGRRALNFTAWGAGEEEASESAESVREGSMPPPPYLLTHPGAKLSTAEKEEFVRGLIATFGEARRGRD